MRIGFNARSVLLLLLALAAVVTASDTVLQSGSSSFFVLRGPNTRSLSPKDCQREYNFAKQRCFRGTQTNDEDICMGSVDCQKMSDGIKALSPLLIQGQNEEGGPNTADIMTHFMQTQSLCGKITVLGRFCFSHDLSRYGEPRMCATNQAQYVCWLIGAGDGTEPTAGR
eukprot:gnl/Hemi2/8108_TR2786_c0_g1_i1.p1 gnl/Hemi2/8108_TR2786_c0_g1~~gnl/Hemi2/8108_TR2786_c0_g1_i1.p1  ORF type:complete len:169 (-),score=39.63 gnl/Hemi2/8108_TR2786_c0_g1_i1:126-632(-)